MPAASRTRGRGAGALPIWSALAAAAAAAAANLAVTGEPAHTRLLLVLPALIAVAPLIQRDQVVVAIAAALLVAWCLASLPSVGLLYLPAAVLMGVAALRTSAPRSAAGGLP